jgi:hypothetical protein
LDEALIAIAKVNPRAERERERERGGGGGENHKKREALEGRTLNQMGPGSIVLWSCIAGIDIFLDIPNQCFLFILNRFQSGGYNVLLSQK